VAAKPEKKEQLKNRILAALRHYRETPEEIRDRDALPRLVEAVLQWCLKCVYFEETHDFELEILQVTKRCAKKSHEGDEFFRYLKKALENGRKKYYSRYETFQVKVPQKLKDLKRYRESAGKILTEDEFVEQVRHRNLLPKPRTLPEETWEKRVRSYYRVLTLDAKIYGPYDVDNEGKEYSVLDTAKPIDTEYQENPEETFERKFLIDRLEANAPQIREKIVDAFPRTQKGKFECDRALWTLRYIEQLADFGDDFPLIDAEIVQKARNNEKLPTQAEIWQKYHPNCTEKKSAEAAASNRSAKIVEAFTRRLKESCRDVPILTENIKF
jgi:hypothetical protein